MSRIECKWAISFVLTYLHSIRLMWSKASELGLRHLPHYEQGIWNQRFYSENESNVFRVQYAGGNWKRRFHSENTSNIFRAHYAGGIWKLIKCFQTRLRRRNLKTEVSNSRLKTHRMLSNHTTPEEFENEGFTLKTCQMFSNHTAPEEFQKRSNHWSHFGFWGKLGQGITGFWYKYQFGSSRFRKAPFSKRFPSTWKRKSDVFKFLQFEERFRNALFLWRLIWTVSVCLTVEIKLRFEIPPPECGQDLK